MTIHNGLSFDVEDWFQVYNYEGLIPRSTWDVQDLRVERNVAAILLLLERRGVRATFFTLGWIADRCPDMVRRIVDGGHEVASHGYAHRRVIDMTPEEFRDDVTRSLESLTRAGAPVVCGYRAPSFSIVPSTLWALDALKELGLVYDSSIVPTSMHIDYGFPDAPMGPWLTRSGLWEIPMTVLPIGGVTVPVGGGGWFRVLPYRVSRWAMRRTNAAGRPVVFYLHPWEVDPGQPMVRTSCWRQARQHINLSRTLGRLERLLDDFSFRTVGALIQR